MRTPTLPVLPIGMARYPQRIQRVAFAEGDRCYEIAVRLRQTTVALVQQIDWIEVGKRLHIANDDPAVGTATDGQAIACVMGIQGSIRAVHQGTPQRSLSSGLVNAWPPAAVTTRSAISCMRLLTAAHQ